MSAAIRGHRATGLRTWQQHGRELATAGPADRAGRQPTRGSGARRAGSFLVDLRRLRFCKSYIGCPEHLNPLQQHVWKIPGLKSQQTPGASSRPAPSAPRDIRAYKTRARSPPAGVFSMRLLLACTRFGQVTDEDLESPTTAKKDHG
jgi:hypothetical protein